MPLTTISSYPITMSEIALHWGQVNTALGGTSATDLFLPGAYSLTQFQADKSAIENSLSNIQDLDNTVALRMADRDTKREALRVRLLYFRKAIEAQLPGSRYLRAMPETPQVKSSEGKILTALDDMSSLWAKINSDTTTAGFTPPLKLQGGYTLSNFTADLSSLRNMYESLNSANSDLKLARVDRDQLLNSAYERMKQYRLRIEADFLETDPLRLSLPEINPSPGSTPEAVNLSGQWISNPGHAIFSWTESDESNLSHYELRFSVGNNYNSNNFSNVGTFQSGQLATQTINGLQSPGATATYKVFVVLSTGNESGSNPVTIVRP